MSAAEPRPLQVLTGKAAARTPPPERQPGADGKKDEPWIYNRAMPRCRRARTVNPSVLAFNLPLLRDGNSSTRPKLMVLKLRLCCYGFEFGEGCQDTLEQAKEKELKRSTLLELVAYLTDFKPSLTEREVR